MEIKNIIIEERRGNIFTMQIIETPEVEWQLEDRIWIPYFDGKIIPGDWIIKYTCEKCGGQGRDELYSLKKRNYESVCRACRRKQKEKVILNAWTEVEGHKVQGLFEEMVAKWLIDHNIEFQTHGEIERKIYYTTSSGKRRKFHADFYLPKYNLFLEPYTTYKDFLFEKKTEELEVQGEIFILTWDNWQNELSDFIATKQ